MSKVLGIIFCSMNDEQLGGITSVRTLGSIPFGSRYRLIDFILSSMTNSGIEHVGVVTKSNYQSLMDHLGNGRDWDLARKREGLYILPPFGQGTSSTYRGKIDALSNVAGFIEHSKAEYVVLSEANVVLNIDINKVVSSHEEKGADITCVYENSVIAKEKAAVSVLYDVAENGEIEKIRIRPNFEGRASTALSIIVIKRKLLLELVADQMSLSKYSFNRDILQKNIGKLKIFGYEHDKYSARIRNINNYFSANMELLKKEVRDQLFLQNSPIFSKVHDAVPAVYRLDSSVSNSLIGDACVIEGKVENSILFRGVKVGKGVTIKNSIVLQSSVIENESELDCCIIDKNVTVKRGRILNGHVTHPVYISKGSQV